jgi:hypothetical protein
MGKHEKNKGQPPEGDYARGYKRPPEEYRFPKGKSANPSGRPKRPPTLKEVMTKVAAKAVTVNMGQGPEDVPMLEAIILARAQAALKGGVGASKAFTEDCDRLGVGVEPVERELTENDRSILADFLREYRTAVVKVDK